jgi:hypothetical protein
VLWPTGIALALGGLTTVSAGVALARMFHQDCDLGFVESKGHAGTGFDERVLTK